MSSTSTKPELRTYIKRELGSPVINVEVDDDSIDQLIDDCVDLYQRYAGGEGNYHSFVSLNLSAGVTEYSLSGDSILEVVGLDVSVGVNGINTLFSPSNILLQNSGSSLINNSLNYDSFSPGLDLASYHVDLNYLDEIQNTFGTNFLVIWRPLEEKLIVSPTPETNYTGLIQVYKKEIQERIYNSILFRDLVVAKVKMLWGNILKKYDTTMAGGGNINGRDVYQEGKDDYEKALQTIKDESEPPMFYVG